MFPGQEHMISSVWNIALLSNPAMAIGGMDTTACGRHCVVLCVTFGCKMLVLERVLLKRFVVKQGNRTCLLDEYLSIRVLRIAVTRLLS
jgi:hypothetical protein